MIIMGNIRNFVIISHVDHGKSTLADRLLELTGTVPKEKMRQQYLDSMDLEQERGITIKMHPVRMEDKGYVLNLIDTPGHVDFSYEVSRALACVEGAILLVDATKGIQAQTIANLEQVQKQGLVVIPAVNKVDLSQAKVKETKTELANLLEVPEHEIFEISAKRGTNIERLLASVISAIPPPKTYRGPCSVSFRALIFDSKYDYYKGAISYVRVFDGEIKTGEKIYLMSNRAEGMTKEVGYFSPQFSPQKTLKAGEIGYIATSIKEPGKVRVGDTITKFETQPRPFSKERGEIKPLSGYKEPKPMVFASLYPENPDEVAELRSSPASAKASAFDALKDALHKLKLNDASLTFEPETKEGLGRGFRCGFLGNLHAEIVAERLFREFKVRLVVTSPQVVYKIVNHRALRNIYSPNDWPSANLIRKALEPWAKLEVITPNEYLGSVLALLQNFKHIATLSLGQYRQLLIYEAPLRAVITGFYDRLKGTSQGFSSMNYEFLEYREADLVKLDILVAGKTEESLSKIVPREQAFKEGRRIVKKLKETLPPQLFSVPLQASLGGKIIARETLKAKGKDVLASLYGGDYTRKRKLLERQKKGKKELKKRGQVRIPQKVFFELFKE